MPLLLLPPAEPKDGQLALELNERAVTRTDDEPEADRRPALRNLPWPGIFLRKMVALADKAKVALPPSSFAAAATAAEGGPPAKYRSRIASTTSRSPRVGLDGG